MATSEGSTTSAYHIEEALALAEEAENLNHAIGLTKFDTGQFRRINQRLGVVLKLASVHADLAVARAMLETHIVPGDPVDTNLTEAEMGRRYAAAIEQARA